MSEQHGERRNPAPPPSEATLKTLVVRADDAASLARTAASAATRVAESSDSKFGELALSLGEHREATRSNFQSVNERLEALELAQKENTTFTKDNGEAMAEIREWVKSWKRGFDAIASFGRGLSKVGQWGFKALKIAAAIVGSVSVIYTALHGFKLPVWPWWPFK